MDELISLGRRHVLGGGAAALAALLLSEGAQAARERARGHQGDPRHGLAQRLADLVLPRTDTPGAADVDAGAFVLLALDARIGGVEPGQLTRVSAALDAAGGAPFLALSRARQEALLAALDARAYAGAAAPGSAEADWPHLKAAILAGYYTSQVGASVELRYDPVPGTRENITMGKDFRMFSNEGFGGSL